MMGGMMTGPLATPIEQDTTVIFTMTIGVPLSGDTPSRQHEYDNSPSPSEQHLKQASRGKSARAIDWHSAFTGNVLDGASKLSSTSLERLGIPSGWCLSLQGDHGDFRAIVESLHSQDPDVKYALKYSG